MHLRGDGRIPVLDHVAALLGEMDLRYQQRFDAQGQALTAALLAAEKAVQTALIAAEKAVTKAETATEKRFESVNEFRKTLSDQTANFLPRAEYGSAHQSLVDKINDLATRMDKTEGRSSGFSASWAILIAAVTVAIGLYAAFHR